MARLVDLDRRVALLDEVVTLGRAADQAAQAGRPASTRPLLADEPIALDGERHRLVVDPVRGSSSLEDR